jgi:TetR/AcrR family transcriptional repressor of nem operon
MARVSRELADQHRLAITDASARLFREHGLNGVSVAELMAAAGLTHGGFYGHFASKDDLAAEACRSAFARSIARWQSRVAASGDPAAARQSLITHFLSPRARSSPGTTCPAAGLAGDVAREPAAAPVRASFREGVAGLVDILAALEDRGGAAPDRAQALADFSTMVGALILSRATAGHAISDALLAAARERLLAGGDAGAARNDNGAS